MTAPIPPQGQRQSSNDRSVVAISVSQRVRALVFDPHINLMVESVFADVCNIVAADGQRYSLVSGTIGDGPLNVVLNRSELFSVIEVGDSVISDSRRLLVGRGWRIDLSRARSWNPMPRYDRLAAWPQVVRTNIAWLARNIAPPSPLVESPERDATVLAGAFGSRSFNATTLNRASLTIHALLTAYQRGDIYRIKTAARRLAGLGPGLTPAGDDWLAGWLVGLRVGQTIDHNSGREGLTVEAVSKAVLQGASNQTTELSLAFMAAAADGALSQVWHQLVDALSSADPAPLRNVADQVMLVGATSGADMLAGFLAAFDHER